MNTRPKIRVGGVPEHFNLPWHNLIADGGFAAAHCDVEFVEYPGGTGAMTKALDAHEIDVALLLFEGAVTNILRGHSNRIVKVYVQSPLIWGIHTASHSKIESVDDIRDKVYAISRAGSGSHLIAIVDAAERGWSTDTMKFSRVDNLAGAREKLANGKVDVFFWERYTTQPLVDSGELKRVGERIVPWPAFVVSARQDVLDNNAAKLHRLLVEIETWCRRFKSDADSTSIVSEKFGIKLNDVKSWFASLEFGYGFERPDSIMEKLVGYLQQVGIVENVTEDLEEIWFDLE